MIRRPPRSTLERSSAASDVYKRQAQVEQQIDEFKQSAVKIQQGQDYFALLETRSLKLQHRVAYIIRQVQFAPNCSKPALWAALCHYQQQDGNVDKSAPVDFLAEDQRAALTATDGKFRVSLYKALFFVAVSYTHLTLRTRDLV